MKPYLLLALLPFAMMLSCQSKESDSGSAAIAMSSDPAELNFEYTAGTQNLIINSSTEPQSIKCKSDWCTLKTNPFSDNKTVVEVSVTENEGTKTRTASINVIGNKESLIINITQGIKQLPLIVEKTDISCSCSGLYDGSFTVTSSSQPSVSSNASWCYVEAADINDEHDTQVTLYIAGNRSSDARSAEITISCGAESKTIKVSQSGFSVKTATASKITPKEVFDAIQMGWGMGNHMDAFNSSDVASETAWGNSKCTQATMDGVKKAGFKSVRIPITWMGKIGKGPVYKIDDTWMERVAEIVGYAKNAGLVAIINTHHDENDNGSSAHWLDIKSAYNNSTKNEAIKDEIFCVWSQIAMRFKDEGEYLIMEPFNEIQDGGWGWSDAFKADPAPQYKTLNEWNQVFVDAVRATGGNNATRWISTVGYAQSSGFTIPGLQIPTDYTTENRIIVAFHDYDPYNYTLADPLVEQWGHTADPAKRCSSTDEANIVYTFDQFKEAYIDKGIPVYMGEMGCSFHGGDNFKFQKYYIEYFCKAAADRGIPMIVWDNGAKGEGAECHSYIDHGTGAYQNDNAKTIIDLMVKAVTDKSASYTLESVWDSAPTN